MTTTTDDLHRARARSAINAARRGLFPKPKSHSSLINSQASSTSSAVLNDNLSEKARENSIEVYDDPFGRNSILTRSARMRKFKFYQYKPIQDNNTPRSINNTATRNNQQHSVDDSNRTGKANGIEKLNNPLRLNHSSPLPNHQQSSPQIPGPAILMPRDDVLKGKIALTTTNLKQSKELSDLDEEILVLEKKIEDLKKDNEDNSNLHEIYELVNKKNDLLRRQMQLNILEQEKVLEKANEELTKELRSLLSIDDSKKTPQELERQKYLYEQSLALVNKRNELVYHLDVQEKAIEEDNALKETLKMVISKSSSARNKINGQDQNCCIQ